MTEPWLSVVMPTYNGERYVAAALESVCREDDPGVELVVVDDGSTDRTREIVEGYARRAPVRLIAGRHTGNWVASTNAGLRSASGRLACILHQDDLWLPGRAARVRAASAGGDARLIVHPAVFIGEDGGVLGRWTCPLREPSVPAGEFLERLLVQNTIAIAAPTFDRRAALASGGLDESLWYTADWDLWLRLGAPGPVRFLREPLAGFRVHDESQTIARPTTRDELLAQMRIVFERHLPRLDAPRAVVEAVRHAAEFSMRLNASLAAAARGAERLPAWELARGFARLGVRGGRRYLRDSRIVERVRARLLATRRWRAASAEQGSVK